MEVTETLYFTDTSYTPTALLRRRAGHSDEAWVGGVWRPTDSIIDWMFGRNDFVEPISEAEAIEFAPDAR